jgi:hypothetical protein
MGMGKTNTFAQNDPMASLRCGFSRVSCLNVLALRRKLQHRNGYSMADATRVKVLSVKDDDNAGSVFLPHRTIAN